MTLILEKLEKIRQKETLFYIFYKKFLQREKINLFLPLI